MKVDNKGEGKMQKLRFLAIGLIFLGGINASNLIGLDAGTDASGTPSAPPTGPAALLSGVASVDAINKDIQNIKNNCSSGAQGDKTAVSPADIISFLQEMEQNLSGQEGIVADAKNFNICLGKVGAKNIQPDPASIISVIEKFANPNAKLEDGTSCVTVANNLYDKQKAYATALRELGNKVVSKEPTLAPPAAETASEEAADEKTLPNGMVVKFMSNWKNYEQYGSKLQTVLGSSQQLQTLLGSAVGGNCAKAIMDSLPNMIEQGLALIGTIAAVKAMISGKPETVPTPAEAAKAVEDAVEPAKPEETTKPKEEPKKTTTPEPAGDVDIGSFMESNKDAGTPDAETQKLADESRSSKELSSNIETTSTKIQALTPSEEGGARRTNEEEPGTNTEEEGTVTEEGRTVTEEPVRRGPIE